MSREGSSTPRGAIGLAAVACVACCAGPIVAWVGALSLGAALGYALFGSVALVVAVALGAVLVRRRRQQRRRQAECVVGAIASVPVPVAAPRVKAAP